MEGTVSKPGTSLLTSGNLIAYWRKRRQGKPNTPLSISELATLCRISPASLRHYESGKVIPPTQTLFALAAALDIPPHILLAPLWRKMRETLAKRRGDIGFSSPVPEVE